MSENGQSVRPEVERELRSLNRSVNTSQHFLLPKEQCRPEDLLKLTLDEMPLPIIDDQGKADWNRINTQTG